MAKMTRAKQHLKSNLLVLLLIVAIALGVGLGAALREANLDEREQMYFAFPGELFMRMLKMLIIPLIVSTLVAGLAGLDATASGTMGLRAIVYYMSTTFIAVVLGIILVVSIRPGDRTQVAGNEDAEDEPANVADSFLDLIRNMFPDNIIEACFRNTKTQQFVEHVEVNITNDDGTFNSTINGTTDGFSVDRVEGLNVLGLVVFSVALGISISRLGDAGKPLYLTFLGLAEAMMKLVVVVIWISPVGIMFLIATEVVRMEDPVAELEALGLYMATVLTGLAIHGFIILPLLYFVVVRRNPFKYMLGMLQAMATALGTASSSGTLPVTYKCLEENNHVSRKVTRFVLPVGATVNMDGTALYEAVAVIFIAQMRGIELSVGEIIATSITATAASIGAAAVPGAGLITMVIVLTAIGLPTEDVSKILAVDWLLDRFRTMINVEGDAFGAGIVAHLCRRHLEETEETPETPDANGVVHEDGHAISTPELFKGKRKPAENGSVVAQNGCINAGFIRYTNENSEQLTEL